MASKSLVNGVKDYPVSVFFILGNEFCERFSFYGMKAILMIYFLTEYNFSQSTATLLYHAFVCLAYFSPLFGSIAADNYFGRFRVILWVSLIYVIGHILMSVGAIPYLDLGLRSILDFSGLFIIAVATGGIKPCVSSFAADQFGENQSAERTQFFSFFYFAVNAGSFLAILITPIIRSRVKCFGSETCFPLAFGIPGVLMLLAFLFFLSGWKHYKPKQDTAAHWIDYAAASFDKNIITGVKSLCNVAVIYGPIALFWALYDQQAMRMDGRVGSITILPDQISLFNPIMILILVPTFELVFYPLARKICKVTSLRRMGCGLLFASLSFCIAGLLQLNVNKTMEPLPGAGNVVLRVYGNGLESLKFNGFNLGKGRNELPAFSGSLIHNGQSGETNHPLNVSVAGLGYVIGVFKKSNALVPIETAKLEFPIRKTDNGRTKIYTMVSSSSVYKNGYLYVVNKNKEVENTERIESNKVIYIKPAFFSSPDYTLYYGKESETDCKSDAIKCSGKKELYVQMGAAHVLLVDDNEPQLETIVKENSISILWQLPQMFVISLGEIALSITGLEFSYSEATPNMKSVLQALWLMTVFVGNIIDMSISGTKIIEDPANELFFYAFLMFVVLGFFILLAMRYVYVTPEELTGEDNEEKKVPLPEMTTLHLDANSTKKE
uniref:MFS domain-containing protein n=1 Tax=Rhabditophanes sp. KR3021 TaxID=114890 RepID=A0AC35TR95_9BILA